MAVALLGACASRKPTVRDGFLVSATIDGGALHYTDGCTGCQDSPGTGMNLQVGYMLGHSGKLAGVVDIGALKVWPEDFDPVTHVAVMGGIRYWATQALWFSGGLGVGGTAFGAGEDDSVANGVAGTAMAGYDIVQWKTTALLVTVASTMGDYTEGFAFDVRAGFGFMFIPDFSPNQPP